MRGITQGVTRSKSFQVPTHTFVDDVRGITESIRFSSVEWSRAFVVPV